MNEESKKIYITQRLQEIEKEIEGLYELIEAKEKAWDNSKPFDEYWAYMKPENRRLAELDREKRMIMPYELSDLPDYGDVMPLKDFIRNVKCGGFIDYDGYGHYVKDGKETDITIHPSDVEHKALRKEFDTIVWFNR